MGLILRGVHVTIVAMAEQWVLLILSVCLYPLNIQHAKRIRPIVSSPVACPAVTYFSTLSERRHDIRQKVIEHKMCSDILYKYCFKQFSF